MFKIKPNPNKQEIIVPIPLTGPTGKIRIKERSMFDKYGQPFFSRSQPMKQDCYIEWQIGYDVEVGINNDKKLTTLENLKFISAKNKEKLLYELSEYIYYFYKWDIITTEELESIKSFLEFSDKKLLIDVHPEYAITRNHPVEKEILGMKFLTSFVNYPLLIYKFGKYEVLAEITIREKQRAVGVQPMLYFCFPITELKSKTPLIGRMSEVKEKADFIIDRNNIDVFLDTLKVFGILSESHQTDTIRIIETILNS